MRYIMGALVVVMMTTQSVYALTVRANMQVEEIVTYKDGVYEYSLLSSDCTGGWDNYTVYSRDAYKAGDWVVVTIDLCNEEDGLQIDDVRIIEPYKHN